MGPIDNTSLFGFYNTLGNNNSGFSYGSYPTYSLGYGASNVPGGGFVPSTTPTYSANQMGASGPTSNSPYGLTSKQFQQGSAAAGILDLGYGIYQTISSNKALNDIESQPFPFPTVSGELQSAYNKAAGLQDTGMSAEEKASFESDVNRSTATNVLNAERVAGGNLSESIAGITNANQVTAYDKLAAINAEEINQNRQNYYTLANQVQAQKNKISDAQMNRRTQLEEQYGNMLQSGEKNIMNSAASLAMLAPSFL